MPIEALSHQPEFEVRAAALDVAGEQPVRVWYRHLYAIDVVDVIALTSR